MRENNLNSLRLMCALGVVISHAFPFARGGDWAEPLFRLSGGQATLGRICVLTFFAISGYLITASYRRSVDPLRFLLARGRRLYPGLTVVLLAVAFGLGPIVSILGPWTYLQNPAPYAYVVHGLVFRFDDRLPGVFAGIPFAGAVNGSLWTLYYEVVCYLIVLAFGLVRLLRLPVLVGIVAVLVVLVRFWKGGDYASLGLPFAMGALLQVSGLRLRWEVAALCALGCLVSLLTRGFGVAFGVLGTYLVLAIGLAPARLLPDPRRRIGDLSYGIYLWAFPTGQLMAQLLGGQVTWWAVFLLSTPPTLVLAWLSWHLVEEPCEALKPPARYEDAIMPDIAVGLPRARDRTKGHASAQAAGQDGDSFTY